MDRSIVVTEQGRSGEVIYRETGGETSLCLSFFWEFGAGDVVASVRTGTEAEWRATHPWALSRRSEILHFVAAELIRQKASRCRAEIDDAGGWINLRNDSAGPPTPPGASQATHQPPPPVPSPLSPPVGGQRSSSWPTRLSRLRMAVGIGTGVAALCVGGGVWLAGKALSIDPGKGTPVGECARTGAHVSVLIQTLEPYVPSPNRDHSKNRQRLSIFVVPLDGSAPRLIPVAGNLEPNAYSLAKILGSDGRTIWFDAVGLHGVDERSFKLVDASDLQAANPSLPSQWWDDTRGMEVAGRLRITTRDRSQALEIDPVTLRAVPVAPQPSTRSPLKAPLTDVLAAGFQTSPTTWLGLHSAADLEGAYKPSRWVRRIEHADDAKVPRRLCRGELEPSESRGKILSMTPLGDTEYINAAFVRADRASEPLRLADPAGALMIWSSTPGLGSTVMVGRVDDAGTVLWQVDTGIDRFKLAQILPGKESTVLVGTRPPVPDKVSEPILVIVEHSSGQARTVSLWQ